ncbi:LCP family protein [Streptomyces vinaceus]|uniref:LCP family protein n=1 Tax=Streptomyces vinaceus TaxID=1960 RepID=UPI0035DE2E73
MRRRKAARRTWDEYGTPSTFRSSPTRIGRIARAGVWVASCAVLAVTGTGWAAYHSLAAGLNTSDALTTLSGSGPQHHDDSVNVLLMGLDSRKDMNGNDLPKQFVQDELHAGSSDIGYYNTNTLILLHIPAGGGRVQAFSIPRDDYVKTYNGDGSAQGDYKIKEAYGRAYSAMHDQLAAKGITGADLEGRSREAGREATLQTVRNFLNVPVDHFAEVNLLGFYDLAKVIQPVTVCLNHPVNDRYSGADFPAGVSRLNAAQALAFVRQRHGLTGGDLDRTHRQQAFLLSVIHQLRSQGLWNDLGKLNGLLGVAKKDLVLDAHWNVLDFVQHASGLTSGNVVFRTLPITGFANRNGEAVNLVDTGQVQKIVREAFENGPRGPQASGGPSGAPGSGNTSARPQGSRGTPAQDSGSGRAVQSDGVPCVD